MNEPKILATRHIVKLRKRDFVALGILIALGIALLVISTIIPDEGVIVPILAISGIFFIVLGVAVIILNVVLDKKKNKRKDIPAIILKDEFTLQFNLPNGKKNTVAINEIDYVNSKNRTSVGAGIGFYTVETNNDGTIKVYLKNGTKFSVSEIEDIKIAQDLIMKIKNDSNFIKTLLSKQNDKTEE